MNKTYCRKIIFCSLPVSGFYRYGDTFQILPPDKTAPKPPAVFAHHPLIIEYCFDTPEIRYFPLEENSNIREPIPHWITINDVANEKLNELLRILCVLTNFRFFVYSADQAWFTPLSREEKVVAPPSIAWGQKFYSYPEFESVITDFSEPHYLPMSTEDPQSYYNRFGTGAGNMVDLPGSIDDTILKLGLTQLDWIE